MKRAAIYLRVSSQRQAEEGTSIPAQRDALRKFINDRPDMVFAGEYTDDGISGTKLVRDELQRLLEDVQAGKIDIILITKLDRWFRSVRHYTATQAILDRHGVGWLAIWEPIYDTTTPQGRLIVNQMMSIAQFEAEQTGQRIRQVFDYKVQQGQVITGKPPHGYKIVDKRLVPSETKDNVIRAFKAFSRTGSINGTLIEVNGLQGLPRLHTEMKKMLTNPVYIGEYRGNKSFCEPIIDLGLWEDVQRQIPMNIKKSRKYPYLFTGLLRCKTCGRTITGDPRKLESGNITLTYRCPKHYKFRPAQCTNKKVLSQNVLEGILLEELERTIKRVNIEVKPRKNDNAAQITATERRLSRLKELYLNELITLDEYKRDKEELTGILDRLRAEAPAESVLQGFKGINVIDLYKSFTPQEKRRFWRSVIDTVWFGEDRSIEIKYK